MRSDIHVITSLAVALTASACGGKGEAGEASGAGGAAAVGAAASGGLELAEQTFEFPVQRNEDQRKLTVQVTGQLPKGWAPDPAARSGETAKTLLPPAVEGKPSFLRSNLTISLTCHGQCSQDKLPSQITAAAERQLEFAAGADKKLTKNEQIRDGIWGFVVESGAGDTKSYTLGVTHWKPGWPQVFFCNAFIQGEHVDAWETVYKACADMKVAIVDPMMPADVIAKETENLGSCPKASSITFTPEPVREGEPTEFGEVKSIQAWSSRPGYVALYLANFELTTTRFNKTPLEGDQRVIKLILEHKKEGELLSGKHGAKYEQATLATPSLVVAGGRQLQWASHSTEGEVEVIARTPDKICGTINLRGGNRGTLTGTFVADIQLGSGK